jgi:hypothetical protein
MGIIKVAYVQLTTRHRGSSGNSERGPVGESSGEVMIMMMEMEAWFAGDQSNIRDRHDACMSMYVCSSCIWNLDFWIARIRVTWKLFFVRWMQGHGRHVTRSR